MRRGVCAVMVASALAVVAMEARADPPAAARREFDAGSVLYQKGSYLAAAARFEAAFMLDPDPAYAFNTGQAYRFAKKCARAAFHYRAYLERAGATAANRDKVERYLDEVTRCAADQARELVAPASAELCALSEKEQPRDPAGLLDRGRCADHQGKLATALTWYRKTHERAMQTGAREVDDAAMARMAELAGRVPTLHIVAPAGATIVVDGVAIAASVAGKVEVDPGVHVVAITGPGTTPERREIEARAGHADQVVFAAAPRERPAAPPPRGNSRRLAYVLGGAGVGLLAGSATLGFIGKQKYDDAAGDDATRDRWRNIVRYGGTSLFVVGAAAVTGAVILYVRRAPRRTPETVIAPVVAPDHVGLALEGAF